VKTGEKIAVGAVCLVAVTTVTYLLWPKEAEAAPLPQLYGQPGKLVIAIPQDDSPCSSTPVLIWIAPVVSKFATSIGAMDLDAEADPQNIRAAVIQFAPQNLFFSGHGNPSVYTCQRCEPFFTTMGLNLDLVVGRCVHLLSCLTGQNLGPQIVAQGARMFFGYREEFWAIIKGRPGCGRFVDAPFYGDIEIETVLYGGETNALTIYARAIARIDAEIDYWSNYWMDEEADGRISDVDAQLLISILIHNKNALVYYTSS
jgi:hypothetical protein